MGPIVVCDIGTPLVLAVVLNVVTVCDNRPINEDDDDTRSLFMATAPRVTLVSNVEPAGDGGVDTPVVAAAISRAVVAADAGAKEDAADNVTIAPVVR